MKDDGAALVPLTYRPHAFGNVLPWCLLTVLKHLPESSRDFEDLPLLAFGIIQGFAFDQIIKSCIASGLFPPLSRSLPVEAMVPTRRFIGGFNLFLDDPQVGLEEPVGLPRGCARC